MILRNSEPVISVERLCSLLFSAWCPVVSAQLEKVMSSSKSYKELEVWKEARKLVKMIYTLTDNLPDKEKYNLSSQLQRAAISIVSNVAEGVGRNTKKDTTQFIFMARGSIYELETQLLLCLDLSYLEENEIQETFEQIEMVRKLLSGFINYLQKNS